MGELEELGARELDRWALYWIEEPWGPLRDNMHAALIVTELLRPHLKEGATLKMGQFLFRHQDDIDAEARMKFVAQLNAMAGTAERGRRRGTPKRIRRSPSST